MALSDECVSRLENWKFAQARDHLTESRPTEQELAVVHRLADAYGDVGWFDGTAADEIRDALRAAIGDAADTGARFRSGVRGTVQAVFGVPGDETGRSTSSCLG